MELIVGFGGAIAALYTVHFAIVAEARKARRVYLKGE